MKRVMEVVAGTILGGFILAGFSLAYTKLDDFVGDLKRTIKKVDGM